MKKFLVIMVLITLLAGVAPAFAQDGGPHRKMPASFSEIQARKIVRLEQAINTMSSKNMVCFNFSSKSWYFRSVDKDWGKFSSRIWEAEETCYRKEQVSYIP